jgi:hypothetical protein
MEEAVEVRKCRLTLTVLFVPKRQMTTQSFSEAHRPVPYNPLDKAELARSVEAALLNSEMQPLAGVPEFYGAGIYAVYYQGSLPYYGPIAAPSAPIYVGKAVPKGARKALTDERVIGKELWERLGEHRESAHLGEGLDPDDFLVRYLVADEVFIPLAERLMIRTFKPVWNRVVDGFGNHDPGSGRYDQKVSRWDTIHPGRPWVQKLRKPCRNTQAEIIELIKRHFGANPPVIIEARLPPRGPVAPLDDAEVADDEDEPSDDGGSA